jgi:hypothetical protein
MEASRYLDCLMLINVQRQRRESNGTLIATVLDGHGGTKDLRLIGEDAAKVERLWAQNQFDLDRYARQPLNFPTPASIPVEISNPAER